MSTHPTRAGKPAARLRRTAAGCLGILIGLAAGSAFAAAKPAAPPAEFSGEAAWDFQQDAALPALWRPLSGSWKIESEPEHPANRVLAQKQASPKLAVLATEKLLCNFEFTCRLRTDTFEHKSRNWQMGVVFRRQDAGRYYKLQVTAARLALIRMTPHRPDTVAGVEGRTTAAHSLDKTEGQLLVFQPLGPARDVWRTLGIRCQGESITVSLDGKELQTVTDPGVGSGILALFTSNTPAYFDDLKLSGERIPKLGAGPKTDRDTFEPFQGKDLRIYYTLPSDSAVTARVLDPSGRVFNILTQDVHSAGINCLLWNGQGLTGQNPLPGAYTIELTAGGKTARTRVQLKTASAGKAPR